MARKLNFKRQSEDEEIKQAGLHLDLDEIAKAGAMSTSDANIAKCLRVCPTEAISIRRLRLDSRCKAGV